MKKLSFIMGTAALLLTASCSNDELVEATQPQGIGFSTFVDNSTRTTYGEINGTSLQDFSVWAVTWSPATPAARVLPSSVFIGHKVYRSGSIWEYEPEKYWNAGDNYRFSAIAPHIDNTNCLSVKQNLGDLPDNISEIKGGLEITFDNSIASAEYNPTTTPTKKIGANIDLCYAFKPLETVAANQDPVVLEFNHMLSRVKFTFKNTFPSQFSAIKITKLKITNATAKASINKVNGEKLWTADPANETFVIDFNMQPRASVIGEEKDYILGLSAIPSTETAESKETLKQNEQESNHHYIFPLNETRKYNVSFTVELYNYDPTQGAAVPFVWVATYDHSVELPSISYENGYSYNFVAEINNKNVNPLGTMYPIEFTPSVSPWKDFTEQTVTVPEGPGSTGTGSGSDAGGSTNPTPSTTE